MIEYLNKSYQKKEDYNKAEAIFDKEIEATYNSQNKEMFGHFYYLVCVSVCVWFQT